VPPEQGLGDGCSRFERRRPEGEQERQGEDHGGADEGRARDGAWGLTKKANMPVQKGGASAVVRLLMLATEPCRRPCSFGGIPRDIRLMIAGCAVVQPKMPSAIDG